MGSFADFSEYWNSFPSQYGSDQLFQQVGKTRGGKPIGNAEFDATIASLRERLNLCPEDALLELCCGNGLITVELSKVVKTVYGVDFSAPLIAVAKEHCATANIFYRQCDVRKVSSLTDVLQAGITKALMNQSLQYFDAADFAALLGELRHISGSGLQFLVAEIPDAGCFDKFYDSPQKLAARKERISRGTESILYWWTREEIETIARNSGWTASFFSPPPALALVNHFRFDALLRRANCQES